MASPKVNGKKVSMMKTADLTSALNNSVARNRNKLKRELRKRGK